MFLSLQKLQIVSRWLGKRYGGETENAAGAAAMGYEDDVMNNEDVVVLIDSD